MREAWSAREVGGLVVVLLGAAMLASSVAINPWVGALWKGSRLVDYRDVLGSYFAWSLALGSLTLFLGSRIHAGRSGRIDDLTLLVLVLSALILGDRLMLVKHGLGIWVHDPVVGHRNRPGAVRTLSGVGRPRDRIRINRYGHHDRDFDRDKAGGELRGLMLGDSVTMGWGVPYEETFSKHLEDLLAERDERHLEHQIINAGVSGYSSAEELQILRESMVFGPDFIALGFCMNDLVEPFQVDARLGGVGTFRWVTQASNPITGYLLNETGFGLTLQRIRAPQMAKERALRGEMFNVRSVASAPRDSERYAASWDLVLGNLEEMYALAREAEVPFVLMIFPFRFQLLEDDLRAPQQILREHAAAHGVPVLDLTGVFESLVYDDPELLALLRRRGYPADEIEKFFDWKLDQYFLDADHFTDRGHRVVAEVLMEHLASADLVGAKAP